jgi:hypothetical protein
MTEIFHLNSLFEAESEYEPVPTLRSPTRRELREEDDAADEDSEDDTMRPVGTIGVLGVNYRFLNVADKFDTEPGPIIGLGISFDTRRLGRDTVKRSKPEPVTELMIPQVESCVSSQTSQCAGHSNWLC